MMDYCWCYYWDAYDSWGFDCDWWADTHRKFDCRKNAERLRLLRRAQSLPSSRVYQVCWHVTATGL